MMLFSLSGSKLFRFSIADGGSRSIWVDSIQLTPPHDGKSHERGIRSCSSPAKQWISEGKLEVYADIQFQAMETRLLAGGEFADRVSSAKGRSEKNFLGLRFGPKKTRLSLKN